jgi:ectoine hydroxylase-related dioxygenase (phytanoyl-CoA dioxygenase family)
MLSEYDKLNWKEKGYCVVNNIVNNDLLDNSNNLLQKLYTEEELSCSDFGSGGKLEFPSSTILDNISLNENIIKCVKQLLDTENILLVQCDTWGKKGKDELSEFSNNDQRMHMDYGNNMFLHPTNWDNPEAVAAIIYLSDINETHGGTALVPREGDDDPLYKTPYKNMPGINEHKFINDKISAENYFKDTNPEIYEFRQELYNKEKILRPNFGDILFYRLDLWHRGTPVKNNKVRFVMNLLWKKKECFWINYWSPGWTKNMYYGAIEKLFTEITPLQRSILGVPLPGDKYWNNENIEFLKVRYPQIDITPYINELKKE